MIVLDIETSGLDFVKCGIWQIGAIDLDTGEEFLEEGRIDNEDQILDSRVSKPVLEVIGKKEENLRDNSKQSQKQLIINFFNWCKDKKLKNCICQHPQFDLGFIWVKARKYGLEIPLHKRAYDLHSIASLKYFQLNKEFLIDKDHSDMDLKNILEFCGMQDNRGAHNALEDCKLTAECFSRLVYKKNLFSEYNKFPIPEYLK
ncbi:3'-5' exonuclease [Candidatus Pacearchaeota archaeon]|nr:3'-5' exonuclease [Candidatus Pacearchaeota archaeon]